MNNSKKSSKKKNVLAKTKKISFLKVMVIVLIIVLLSISIVEIVYFFYKIRHIETISIKLEVSEKPAFTTGTVGLDLGILGRGDSLTREVMLVNQEDKEFKVKVSAKGGVVRFTNFSGSSFILKGKEIKALPFSILIPSNAKYGNYTGKMVIIFMKP